MSDQATALPGVMRRVRSLWAPPASVTVSQWAERYRKLATESSAEPGRWRNDRTPYMVEPADVLSDRHTEMVVIMSSSQIGKTELLNNTVGYFAQIDPCPMLYLQPTLELAAAVSKDRIAPMIRNTPELAELFGRERTRDGSNTVLHKAASNGARITLAGSNSPASLAGRPIRVLLLDEIDRYEQNVGDEGSPVALALKRTSTYKRRKVLLTSTPTTKDASQIEAWHSLSDKREYHTPCPHCGEYFVIRWQHIKFEDRDPSTARIECPLCSGRIEERDRLPMVAKGYWRATAPFSGIRGYWMWEVLSPWRSISDIVSTFLASRQSLEMRQTFHNTSLGLPWEQPGQSLESSGLLARREPYPADLPAGVKLLTAGIDTQDDRLEALILGWGDGEECWVIHGETIAGDPNSPQVWTELDELLTTRFAHKKGGFMSVYSALIDAGGHRTDAVYRAAIARQHRRVWACFGRSGGEGGLIVSPPKAIKTKGGGNVLRRIVDVDQCKALIYGRLKAIEEPGPEFIHFPDWAGETFFDQLTAEKLITKRNRFGVPTKVWQQVKARNEALDTFVYALAALRAVATTGDRFARIASALDLERVRKVA